MQEDGITYKIYKTLEKVNCKLRNFYSAKIIVKYQTVINTKELREYYSHIHFLKNVLENKIQKTKMTWKKLL